MNFVDALVYPYRERNWLPKLGFAVIAALVPVAGLFLLKGWELETSARVFRGERPYLASWGRPHTHLFDGLKVAAAEFIYNIPGMILALYALFGGLIFFIGFFNQPDRTLLHFLELYLE
ncbi:MAG: DUF4013 domain-containing protein, partial [Anaerolineae bacterium]|nr:DUF4013 domain-containing protein [Anaerolineae bacterium]